MSETASQLATSSDRDLVWAAVVLEERGKIHVLGKRVTLTVNSVVTSTRAFRLQRILGGKTYAFGIRQMRWQIDGGDLVKALARVHPFFDDEGQSLLKNVEQLQQALQPIVKPPETVTKVDAFNLVEGVDEDQLEFVCESWQDFEKDERGFTALRSRNAEHTRQWCIELQRLRFTLHVEDDTLIFLEGRS